jgi:hypothetical protein
MWINEGNEMGLPFRKTDTVAIAEVISALESYSLDFEQLIIAPGGLPEKLPEIALAHTSHGCAFYAGPMLDAVPNSQFFNSLGFEFGFAYTTHHNREEGWLEIARLIEKHDKPGIDHLLITVGGPNNKGLGFLTEEVLWAFMLEEPIAPVKPSYLATVTVHVWGTGAIVELIPEYKVITLGLYPSGFALSHHSTVRVQVPVTS